MMTKKPKEVEAVMVDFAVRTGLYPAGPDIVAT